MCIKHSDIYTESLKNNFHLLQKLDTEPILSNVRLMAIRCYLVRTGHFHMTYWPFVYIRRK